MNHIAILRGGPHNEEMIMTEGEKELWLPTDTDGEFAIYILQEHTEAGQFVVLEAYAYSRNYVRPEGVPIGEHHGPT